MADRDRGVRAQQQRQAADSPFAWVRVKAPELMGDLVLDRAIRLLLALRRDAASPAVQKASR